MARNLHRFYQIDGRDAVLPTIAVMCSVNPKSGDRRGCRFFLKISDNLFYHFKINHSSRYRCFSRSLSCARCGIEGTRLAFEGNVKHPESASTHANLYAVDASGSEILMTQDHIVPRAMGGPDHDSNLRTMCLKCNMHLGKLSHKLAKLGMSIAIPADAGALWAISVALEHELGEYSILYSNGNGW